MIHSTEGRLFIAVEHLVVGSESIQLRLKYAALALAPLLEAEFPSELQERFSNIQERVTRVYDEIDGAIEVTTRQMSDDEAKAIAKVIVSLYQDIARGYCNVKR